MFAIDVACSDPFCGEEQEVFVADIEQAELVACECDHCVVVLSVAEFEPIYAAA
ncbi:MAG TPA: hypothetical protein VGC63_07385 [Solirubrobacterales bacterium]